jgi:hypothetical protein
MRNVPDVRSASAEADPSLIFQTHQADIVVSTWMGSRLYIYLMHEAPKVRDIRTTLKENNRCGIGTLYILDNRLLPASEKTTRITDWQEALMSLHGEFIYSFMNDPDQQLSISQVHFTPSNAKDEYYVWHLPNFVIENVSVRKREVQSSVRGTWYIGDIASPQFKRQMNYERVHQRFHYRTRYTQETASGNQPIQRDDDLLAKYYAMLGVDRNAEEKDIKSAFRRIALQVHPDVSALPRQEANRRFQELNQAYEYIKNYHGWA